MTLATASTPTPAATPARRTGAGVVVLAVALVVLIAPLSIWHLSQGTTSLGLADVVAWALGDARHDAILQDGRVPRLAAALVVGVALGVAGYAMQSLVRNPLASPDTLAVNAGAAAALGLTAAFGITLPFLGGAALAFVGGIAAAAIVVAIGRGKGQSTRMILVGTALALALQSVVTVTILLAEQQTRGLFAWGVGQLSQNGIGTVVQALPIVVGGIAVLLVLARRLDLLALGEDTASLLGVGVRSLRLTTLVASVLLAASAVAIAGPIGFVGLAAPAAIRLAGSRIAGLHRHILALPIAGLAGAALVLVADVLLRAVLQGRASLDVPTGVVTSIVGAVFLVVLARTLPGANQAEPMSALGERSTFRRAWIPIAVAAVALLAVVITGLLVGGRPMLLGDVMNWLQGQAGRQVSIALDAGAPRVVAGVLAGAALALAGSLVQTVARNPLADPYLLGVANGAGFGAITVITLSSAASGWLIAGGALAGGIVAAGIVLAVVGWRMLGALRLVLTGIGVSAAFGALTSMLITTTDPWNAAKAITWLGGSTYGRGFEDSLPVLGALVVCGVVAWGMRHDLDLVQLDQDTPRLLGVRLSHVQLLALVLAVLLTGTAVAAVGVVAFVGLIAPHAARALVGSAHHRFVPLAILLGATLVGVADLLGRRLIYPEQLPAGIMTSLVGVPYFILLVLQSRRRAQ
ncbi:iron ABC transporter permease [Agrococcus jejuensis]|uniref:Iron complex transport system permease protein n=1 Tax=Agrococcus jejuensis TaxID=399736 RepID=A0A1G8GTJ5_9MICO|nr:iron ABC transporter permease [Agrococcus jejuensis]SDH97643.1 iron complex transport system permease protein [Agrococcus jejuensis]